MPTKPSKNFAKGTIKEIRFPIDKIKCQILVGLSRLVVNERQWASVADVIRGIEADASLIEQALGELDHAKALVWDSNSKVHRVTFAYQPNLNRAAECRRLLAAQPSE